MQSRQQNVLQSIPCILINVILISMCIFEHIAQFYFDLNLICLLKPDGFIVAIKEFIPFGVSSVCLLLVCLLEDTTIGSRLLGGHTNGSSKLLGSKKLRGPTGGPEERKKMMKFNQAVGLVSGPNKTMTIQTMSVCHQKAHGTQPMHEDELRDCH